MLLHILHVSITILSHASKVDISLLLHILKVNITLLSPFHEGKLLKFNIGELTTYFKSEIQRSNIRSHVSLLPVLQICLTLFSDFPQEVINFSCIYKGLESLHCSWQHPFKYLQPQDIQVAFEW